LPLIHSLAKMPPRAAIAGVELEVVEGITEHSSRVALKGVFQNFGDVVACWVPPIDRRHVDRASVRFGNTASAEAAKAACDQGQVYLQGLAVKVDYRSGGGRRVGNSDLGESAMADQEQKARAILDAPSSRPRKRSRSRRRSRSRGRRSRSKDKRRSRSRRRDRAAGGLDQPALPAPPPTAMPPMAAPMGFPAMQQLPANNPLLASIGGPLGAPALPPADLAAIAAAAANVPDPEEERRKQRELEAARQKRKEQLKRGPGVAALVQGALKKVQSLPPTKRTDDEKKAAEEASKKAAARTIKIIDEPTEEEKERERKKKEAEEEAELIRKSEKEAKEAAERERLEREARERREQAKRDAAEAEKALQKKEAETRDQRIKASVEAAKKQQAERERVKAAKEAGDSLYGNMPQPELADEVLLKARQEAAEQREKSAKLSKLPPEDRSKVVFLDVDGVLRPARAGGFDVVEADSATRVDTSDFFPSAVKALRHIMERTGAILVLSSEWRRSEALSSSLSEFFEKNRMRAYSSITSTKLKLDSSPDPLRSFADRRAREISQWLSENEAGSAGWVVLDDINLALADEARKAATKIMSPHLVQTWPLCGLTMGNAKTAVRILNGEMINKVVVERPTGPIIGGGGAAAGAAAAEGSGGAVAKK